MSVNSDALIGLFFEVTPHLGHSEHYFSYVEKLKPELAKHSGLVCLNRYQTLADDCTLLSYQLWENEKSIENWRSNKMHRLAQEAGIKVHFKNYRIRVGQRVSFWPQGETSKLNNGPIAKSSSLLLCVQSEAPISKDSFAKLGFFESVYCELSDSNQFVTLIRPNDLFCAKTIASTIISDLTCKIDLFAISRDYSMVKNELASQDVGR
jgi:heme-degrading monooxygenase HmoA